MAQREFWKSLPRFRDTFSILQLCRVFHWGCAQQNSSPGCYQLSGVVCEEESSIQPCPARPHHSLLLASIPFPAFTRWQPSNVKRKRIHFTEIFCRMELHKACFIFFFGKSRFPSFLKLSVPVAFICSFSSLTSCSFNITTLWHLLGGSYPSSCWQPSSFQYIITEQGGFLKENKQMSRLQLLLGRQVPGNKHFVSKDTLRSSVGNFSIQVSVVSHKSFCFTQDRRAQSHVISWAWHEWAGDYSGVSSSGQLWGLRTPWGCHFQLPPSPQSLCAAACCLCTRFFTDVSQGDFCRWNCFVQVFIFLLVLVPSEVSMLGLGADTWHESFHLLWISESGQRPSGVTLEEPPCCLSIFFPHVHPWAAPSPCLLPTPSL